MHGVALVASSRLDVLWLDADFSVNTSSFNDATLEEARELPVGALLTPPVAVTLGQNRLAVFGIGRNYSMDHWVYDASAPLGTRWSGPESLGAGFCSTPAAVSTGDNRIDLFALGPDRGMLHSAWTNSRWSSWEELGGGFTSMPVVLPAGLGAFDIFARGLDFQVYRGHWTPGTPPDWEPLGGGLLGEPAAASAPAAVRVRNGTLVFITTADGSISYTEFDGTVWKPWTSMGPARAQTADGDAVTFISEPVAVALYPSLDTPDVGPIASIGLTGAVTGLPPSLISHRTRVHVFAVGSDNALWTKRLDGTGWHPPGNWGSLGGSFACAPSVVVRTHAKSPMTAPPDYLSMAAPFLDGTVHRWSFDPTPSPVAPDGTFSEDQPPRPTFRLPTRYTFAVDNVHIDDTRSVVDDTDVGITVLKVGNWPLQSTTFNIGDVNNGDHQLGGRLAITRTVELCEPIIYTYSIVNNHDSGDLATVSGVIVKGVGDWINDLLKGGSSSLSGSFFGAGVISWLADKLVGWAFGGCDGLVAAEAIVYETGLKVQHQITDHGSGTPRRFATSTRNLRGDAPSGCNSSSYLIYTSITQA